MLIDTMEERYPAAFVFGVARADERGSAAGAWHVAWGHWRAGRHTDAAAAFRRSADRGYDDALGYLAACLQEIGDLIGAESALRRALGRGAPNAEAALAEVDRRRSLIR
jgi:hypothetical protein